MRSLKIIGIVSTLVWMSSFISPVFGQTENAAPAAEAEETENFAHRILNIFEFGAVGDGQSHPLKKTFASQEEIDTKYGSDRYTLEDEADFVAIMEALRAANSAANFKINRTKGASAVIGIPSIYIPQGRYLINRTIPVSDIRGGTIFGDGKRQSHLKFTGKDQPLFHVQRCAEFAFSKLELRSTIQENATAFLLEDTLHEGPGEPTYHFDFDGVYIQEFAMGVMTIGRNMTDSLNFHNCRWRNCLTAVRLNNHQCMGVHFVNCYFGFSTAELKNVPEGRIPIVFHVNQGGNITMMGGYVINHKGTTLLLDPASEEVSFSPINWSTGFYNFYGVRWEQPNGEDPMLFDVNPEAKYYTSYVARVNFDNCVLYQRTAAEGGSVGALHPGSNVTFRNTMFNKNKAFIQEVVDPKQEEKRRGILILDNVSGLQYTADENAPYHHVIERRGPEPVFDPH